jgi:hypothetical protein
MNNSSDSSFRVHRYRAAETEEPLRAGEEDGNSVYRIPKFRRRGTEPEKH